MQDAFLEIIAILAVAIGFFVLPAAIQRKEEQYRDWIQLEERVKEQMLVYEQTKDYVMICDAIRDREISNEVDAVSTHSRLELRSGEQIRLDLLMFRSKTDPGFHIIYLTGACP